MVLSYCGRVKLCLMILLCIDLVTVWTLFPECFQLLRLFPFIEREIRDKLQNFITFHTREWPAKAQPPLCPSSYAASWVLPADPGRRTRESSWGATERGGILWRRTDTAHKYYSTPRPQPAVRAIYNTTLRWEPRASTYSSAQQEGGDFPRRATSKHLI